MPFPDLKPFPPTFLSQKTLEHFIPSLERDHNVFVLTWCLYTGSP